MNGSHPLGMALGWTMIHLLWVGLAVGLVAAVGRRGLRKATPEARYGFALACLTCLAVAPVAVFVRLHDGEVRPWAAAVGARTVDTTPPANSAGQTLDPAAGLGRILRLSAGKATGDGSKPRGKSRVEAWVRWLPWAWLAGSSTFLVILGTGLIGVGRLGRASRPLGPDHLVSRRCRVLAQSLGIVREVGVAACDRLAAPVLLGIIRPLILLPPAAFDCWTAEQIEMALLHELAHFRRWDNHVNLFQRGVEALLFFQPVVWWLSAWIRLERESCCDRLVVERSGRPLAYAAMLAGLAGASGGGRRAALGMADRQVTTRVRRILHKFTEEYSMKMTLPEGFGLLAAAVVSTALAWSAGAAAPPAETAIDPVRAALRQAIADVTALPADAKTPDTRNATLVAIAQAQWKLGDRDDARATLARMSRLTTGPVTLDEVGFWRLAGEAGMANVLREMGDPAGARAALDRLTRIIADLKVEPTDRSRIKGDGPGQFVVDQASLAMIKGEMLAGIITERIALGDRTEARDAARRGVALARGEPGTLGAAFTCAFASLLALAGDHDGAHEALAEIRKQAAGIAQPAERDQILCYLAQGLSAIGDIDEAISLARSLREAKLEATALGLIVEALAEDDMKDRGTWLDPGGIKILIGATGRNKPKNPAAARLALPRLADAVAAIPAPPVKRARLLSTIAHLQAKAGDHLGAAGTANRIPEVKRADITGPADGYDESVKPGTLAIVARYSSLAGDQAQADALFRAAADQARAIADNGEAIIAWLVVAREQTAGDRAAASKPLLAEAVPLAIGLAEPRRSRSLAMIVAGQVQAGDLAGASRTAARIRDYPRMEKHKALTVLADGFEKVGDHEAAQRALREALRQADSPAPEKPALGKAGPRLSAVSQTTFLDPDLEIDPRYLTLNTQPIPVTLLGKLGDIEAAKQRARTMPPQARDNALAALSNILAQGGDIRGALEVAAAIETPQQRLGAIEVTAGLVGHEGKATR